MPAYGNHWFSVHSPSEPRNPTNVRKGSFADMQQSPRERPLPGAKQTYSGQLRVGRWVYGKEPFSVYLRFEGDSGRISSSGDQGLRGYTEKICFPYKPLPVPKTSDCRTGSGQGSYPYKNRASGTPWPFGLANCSSRIATTPELAVVRQFMLD